MNGSKAHWIDDIRHTAVLAVVIFLGLTAACTPYESDLSQGCPPGQCPDPPSSGSCDYVSAYPGGGYSGGSGGYDAGYGDAAATQDAAWVAQDATAGTLDTSGSSTEDSNREVVRGDIFRLLDGHLILNLNAYRGLQVIDVADVDNPRIIGRLRLDGTAVELHVVGHWAYVLSNPGYSYSYDNVDGISQTSDRAQVMVVDLSDPWKLRPVSEQSIDGSITTSRVVADGERAALYVVSGYTSGTGGSGGTADVGYGGYGTEMRGLVTSFDITEGALRRVGEIDLGGGITAVQATSEVLMVAHTAGPDQYGSGYLVTLVDISDPNGAIVQGGEIGVAGYVQDLFNLDFYQDMLRVVSTDWSTNHVETFDATDIDLLEPLDHETFGSNQNLFATLFLGSKAFFVTYFRQDPFHAFEITDTGELIERTEFIVSGWNDFFIPVFGGDRLIGVGVNDADWQNTMAISLYDSSDLTNPEPLLVRAEVEASNSWSEASWDDRAISVIENAVEVASAGDLLETGLILLPFYGYDTAGSYRSAVQIFTFSPETLTRRGAMLEEGRPVRRSFLVEPDTTGNLSDSGLTLHDTSDPDRPVKLGHVELAPNFTQLFLFGDSVARVQSFLDELVGWWSHPDGSEATPSRIDVVPVDSDVDLSSGIASIEITPTARQVQVGDLLVSVESSPIDATTEITVFDFADPSAPQALSTLITEDVVPGFHEYEVWDPDYGDDESASILVAGDALVFAGSVWEQDDSHVQEVCYTYPVIGWESCWSSEPVPGCVWYQGGVTCTRIDGGAQQCEGDIHACQVTEYYWGSAPACDEEVDPDTIDTVTDCETYPITQTWERFDFDVLDLSDPSSPALVALNTPRDEYAVGALTDSTDLYYSFLRPVDIEGDWREFAAYFFRRVDLSRPAAPRLEEPINVPGELVAVDETTLFTRDATFNDCGGIDSSIARLQLRDGRAILEGRHSFAGRNLSSVVLDGEAHVVVTHHYDWWNRCSSDLSEDVYDDRVTILDGDSTELDVLSQLQLGVWTRYLDRREGYLFYWAYGGILVVDIQDAADPFVKAFHPVPSGYSRSLVSTDSELFVTGGRYGVYRFDLNEVNVATAP